jgi:superfamily I DNA and/or RNA helicase
MMQKDLQEAAIEKLKVSSEITLQRVRERTYTDVEFNRLNNLVTYRDLYHQVSKKRMIWPLRKLINAFYNEIFKLIPCWMASPESVSAIFPMQQTFDLVIFDEASQCFSEHGIPAMYRGKQVVIAGDEKQLTPFDLYSIRWEDEKETDEPALELDSLLDLASRYLMTVQLRGHYRSKTLDLIDFSNRYFYGGHLKLLPDRELVNRGVPAIKYIKTDGVWSKNMNHEEALYIAGLVQLLLKDYPKKEIGIVTFNVRQQEHVRDVLEEQAAEHGFLLPDRLFVKNIENVQGDERDIIIFSIGYAPGKKGKMKHHFGSLNVRGGENRLNVAVTRAREQIYVISSILPHQLSVENTKNEGPKLLKLYLEFAKMVSDGKYIPKPKPIVNNSADWYLKTKLENWLKEEVHCDAREELPFADITISCDDEYLGVIATDDDLYFQSPSVKDAHVYTPLTLGAKHWKYKGFFSRNFWLNEEDAKEEIRIFVNQVQRK